MAPGVGTVSLSDPRSLMYADQADVAPRGSFWVNYQPYLSLSGTSMASPVVAGSVALMLQANPSLTPNLVKGILEYTAQVYPGYDALTEGAGFLNTKGAVDLARFFNTAQAGTVVSAPGRVEQEAQLGQSPDLARRHQAELRTPGRAASCGARPRR